MAVFFLLFKEKKNPTNSELEKNGIFIHFSAFAALKSILRYILMLTQLYSYKVKQEIVSLLFCSVDIRSFKSN